MRSWKDYNVLRESTPVEDRDRIAVERASIAMKNDPDYARVALRNRSYNRNENQYKVSVRKLVLMIRSCMKNLGISREVIEAMDNEIALYGHFDLEDIFASKTSPYVSLYFGTPSNDDMNDVSTLKDFTRKVAQGKELHLGVDTSSNLSFFAEDMDLHVEFNETFKDVLEAGFSERFSKKQTNFMLKLISHCQDGTENPCRALKAAINGGIITLSCNIDSNSDKIHFCYTFSVSSKMNDKEKNLIIRAMVDIMDFTNAFNHEV